MTLQGRTAVVTGGGTGIGAAIAVALAQQGARVTITGRRKSPLDETATRAPGISAAVMDVTDEAQVSETLSGPVDILVANAGIAETMPLAKMPTDFWRSVMATNLDGVMFSIRAVIGGMAARGWGRIVIISSVAGLKGFRYGAAYAASKHAVLGLMKCAAEEVLTKGVTVNALCPGYVATPIVDRGIQNIMAKTGLGHEDALASMRDSNPFGRLIEPEEVADAALWLCGPNAGAVTGQAIPITGGQV